MINIAYVSISDTKPWWFASRKQLKEAFGVSEGFISSGMTELRWFNIIDAKYPELKFENRLAKSYKYLGLYDPTVWREN